MSTTNYTTTETKNLRPLKDFIGQTKASFILFPNGGSAYVRGEVCQRIEAAISLECGTSACAILLPNTTMAWESVEGLLEITL